MLIKKYELMGQVLVRRNAFVRSVIASAVLGGRIVESVDLLTDRPSIVCIEGGARDRLTD